jgi:Sec-independent protein secretion pathway component TatC
MIVFYPLGRLFDPSVGGTPRGSLRTELLVGFVGVVIISAIATPGTDLVSPLVLAITLLLLYGFSIILVRAGGR